jgi:hypothetical protein
VEQRLFTVGDSRFLVVRVNSILSFLCSVLQIVVCPTSFDHCVVCPTSFGRCVVCPTSFGRCVVCPTSFGHCVVCPTSFGRCVVCPTSIGHCVVCPTLIYGFLLPLWYFQTHLMWSWIKCALIKCANAHWIKGNKLYVLKEKAMVLTS